MARIAIFCDGTWNSPRQAQPTHVHRLFRATAETDSQKRVYVEGVGTGGKWASMLGRMINKVGGGAFGWGLNDNIMQAYRELVARYRAGDSVHIYGFSRGAYTARSLAGMIRKVGIVEGLTDARLAEAFALYRKAGPENAPDKPHILKDRRRLSPHFATSQKEIDWRVQNPDGTGITPQLMEIEFLGVWDTVGSLGVPSTIIGPIASLWNRKYKFHDTKLSRTVKASRHALALDERRVFYRPALWDNLEQNLEGPGLNEGNRTPDRPYQQVWFVGTHAIVGGSGATRGLTAITLEWMAQGAQQAGLVLQNVEELLDHPPDAMSHSEELMGESLIYRLVTFWLDWRKGPGHPVDLHRSAEERVTQTAAYRPLSLKALKPELFGGKPIGKM